MTIPTVTEHPRVLEATTADTFIAGDAPVAPSPPPFAADRRLSQPR